MPISPNCGGGTSTHSAEGCAPDRACRSWAAGEHTSFSMTAIFLPCWVVRMWFSSVVFPEPRKPVMTVMGTL